MDPERFLAAARQAYLADNPGDTAGSLAVLEHALRAALPDDDDDVV